MSFELREKARSCNEDKNEFNMRKPAGAGAQPAIEERQSKQLVGADWQS